MERILIVDDSNHWVRYHQQAVRELFGDKVQIDTASSAKEGVERLTCSIDKPYDVILTDMQMESDFIPLYAGEWFIKQIRFFNEYKNTQIIVISATSNIKQVAENFGVQYIPKYKCQDINSYKIINL